MESSASASNSNTVDPSSMGHGNRVPVGGAFAAALPPQPKANQPQQPKANQPHQPKAHQPPLPKANQPPQPNPPATPPSLLLGPIDLWGSGSQNRDIRLPPDSEERTVG